VKPLLSPYLERKRISVVRRYLRGHVLDIGCGPAALAQSVGEDASYVGVELEESVVSQLRAKYPSRCFYAVDVETGRLPSLGLEFDTIALVAAIEHLRRPQNVLSQCYGLLRSDGNLIITTPSRLGDMFHRVGARLGLTSKQAVEEHQKIYSVKEMRALLQPLNFSIDLYRRFGFGMNQLFLCRKVLR
jgi:2-polyprenyl-3-methyl-5-hydroxy-6-metoxy-1,4-benzoquinol methylase